ncbi:MAG: class I SAM-dependent methyltransferase [Nitrosomonadales bacterium]|nr:class I SAM-dependent methyltransferase [Nitrosomonadales bacterium]
MRDSRMTWEESVQWLRDQPDQKELVKAAFYDDPLIEAAERYAGSSEWIAVRAFLPVQKGAVLDIGAGRGIASFALAKDGWDVTALEPDNSNLVGAGAIRGLAQKASLDIEVVQEWGESLPFADATFKVVHCRQVLHHARDLKKLCSEINRVLQPGGTMIATREHVISRKEDLATFLKLHPLHHLYGGENAYLLNEYVQAIVGAGMQIEHVFNPLASDINLYPTTLKLVKSELAHRFGLPSWFIPDVAMRLKGALNNAPGRLYTFVGRKSD